MIRSALSLLALTAFCLGLGLALALMDRETASKATR
jgi:hypothetical protein